MNCFDSAGLLGRTSLRGLMAVALFVTMRVTWAEPGADACLAEARSRIPVKVGQVALLGAAEVQRSTSPALLAFGGISGLDFDSKSNVWYLISDDRAEHGVPRYYKAAIALSADGIGSIEIQSPIPLPLPPGEVPDPESIRVISCQNVVAWSSEGDRRVDLQPSVRLISPDGKPLGQLATPSNLRVNSGVESGSRNNLSFEGLGYYPGSAYMWLAMEAPIYEDGPAPSLEKGAVARFSKLSLSGGPAQQFGYPVDPIPRPASAGKFRADNGVSEILALGENSLLVVERSGREVAENLYSFTVRLYEATSDGATDISSLKTVVGHEVKVMKKRLIIDLSSLQIPHVDNIEGAAWGPRLADGRATLLLVSDDNFASNQRNQFILLSISERQ